MNDSSVIQHPHLVDVSLIERVRESYLSKIKALARFSQQQTINLEYSFPEIRAGVSRETLKQAFGGEPNKDRVSIYAISTNQASIDAVVRDFKAEKVRRGKEAYLSRLNENLDSKTGALYVGGSKSILTRLHNHLNSGGKTYSLHLHRWLREKHGQIQVQVQFLDDCAELAQDIEDGLWDLKRPVFGRRGAR